MSNIEKSNVLNSMNELRSALDCADHICDTHKSALEFLNAKNEDALLRYTKARYAITHHVNHACDVFAEFWWAARLFWQEHSHKYNKEEIQQFFLEYELQKEQEYDPQKKYEIIAK